MQATTITRKWVVKGSKPKVKSAPGKKSIAYSGYVIPSTGELIMTKPTWFTYETVIASFRDFINSYTPAEGKKLLIVIDNAPWHKKAKRLVWNESLPEYADIREKMDVLSLPPYSPDLNPIEAVWKKTRREVTHNRYFKTIDDLEQTLDEYFQGFREKNDELASLCTFKYKI